MSAKPEQIKSFRVHADANKIHNAKNRKHDDSQTTQTVPANKRDERRVSP